MDGASSAEATAPAGLGMAVKSASSTRGVHTVRPRSARVPTFLRSDCISATCAPTCAKSLRAIDSFGSLFHATPATDSSGSGRVEASWCAALESKFRPRDIAASPACASNALSANEAEAACLKSESPEIRLPAPVFAVSPVHAFSREETEAPPFAKDDSLDLRLPPSPRSLAREEEIALKEEARPVVVDRRIRFVAEDTQASSQQISKVFDGQELSAESSVLTARLQKLLSIKSPGDLTYSVRCSFLFFQNLFFSVFF